MTKGSFPKYAIDYFEQIRRQYELLLADSNRQPPISIQGVMTNALASPNTVTWADVFALESAMYYALPNDRVRPEFAQVMQRYRDMASDSEYAAYVAASGINTTARTKSELRAELLSVAGRVRYLYTFAPVQIAMRTRLSMSIMYWGLGALLVFAMMIYISDQFYRAPSVFAIVAFVGFFGGCLSALQRVQAATGGDPILSEMQQSSGWFAAVILPSLFGAVFALVLYVIFIGGLVKGELFPNFPNYIYDGKSTQIGITAFLSGTAPLSNNDWGKLLTWAFVAGFAERFVPGLLDRFTGGSTAASAKVTPAASAAVLPQSTDPGPPHVETSEETCR